MNVKINDIVRFLNDVNNMTCKKRIKLSYRQAKLKNSRR